MDECYSLEANKDQTWDENGQDPTFDIFKSVKKIYREEKDWNQGLRFKNSSKPFQDFPLRTDSEGEIDWRNKDGRNYLTYTKN